jgi:hemerythrin-like domain-containing protein
MWMEVVSKIGCVNFTDDKDLEALQDLVNYATDVYAHHNRDESEWFGVRLRALDEGLAHRWLRDHDEHLQVLTEFRERLQEIRRRPVDERCSMISDYYDYACSFLKNDLEHMWMEQGEIMAVFHAKYTDDELRELEAQFIRERIDPAYMQRLAPLFLRASNIEDRTFSLSIMKEQAPPEAFRGMLEDLAAKIIPAAELGVIKQRIGV